jgi:type II secretory pathway pseudopilin PulG
MRFLKAKLKSGFMLVEALVAIFIIAGTAVVLLALLPSATKTGKLVGNYQQASSLIQHKVDQMRGVGHGRLTYIELSDAGIIDTTPTAQPFSFRTVDGLNSIFPGATGTIAISDDSPTLRRAVVTLEWTGSARRQGNGNMTITVLIAKT